MFTAEASRSWEHGHLGRSPSGRDARAHRERAYRFTNIAYYRTPSPHVSASGVRYAHRSNSENPMPGPHWRLEAGMQPRMSWRHALPNMQPTQRPLSLQQRIGCCTRDEAEGNHLRSSSSRGDRSGAPTNTGRVHHTWREVLGYLRG